MWTHALVYCHFALDLGSTFVTSWLNLYVHGVIGLGEAGYGPEDVQKLEQTIKSDSFYVAGPGMVGQFSLDEESG